MTCDIAGYGNVCNYGNFYSEQQYSVYVSSGVSPYMIAG